MIFLNKIFGHLKLFSINFNFMIFLFGFSYWIFMIFISNLWALSIYELNMDNSTPYTWWKSRVAIQRGLRPRLPDFYFLIFKDQIFRPMPIFSADSLRAKNDNIFMLIWNLFFCLLEPFYPFCLFMPFRHLDLFYGNTPSQEQ